MFTRMDEGTKDDWMAIGDALVEDQPRTADVVLTLLQSLDDVYHAFTVSQLTHCLQTATRAERAGADDEVVIAALCHDIGKAIAAAILKPYVRRPVYDMIRVHQDFQGRHYYAHFGADPEARERHRESLDPETWALAERFADEWDQTAFDPDYDTLPLAHFEERVRSLFSVAPV
jgi:predicted HD phosphohydrolase